MCVAIIMADPVHSPSSAYVRQVIVIRVIMNKEGIFNLCYVNLIIEKNKVMNSLFYFHTYF